MSLELGRGIKSYLVLLYITPQCVVRVEGSSDLGKGRNNSPEMNITDS